MAAKGGTGVKHKYVIWGLAGAAFLVTLGITSWREGLWSSDEPNAQAGGAAASHSSPTPTHPSQVVETPPAAAAAAPPRAAAPNDTPPPAPSPGSLEQAQDDYQQRAKLMQELAERARAQQGGGAGAPTNQ
jgi:hypothetical protein